jgi:hypothetical protein
LSGNESASLHSRHYAVTVSGGVSSWDYAAVRGKGQVMTALLAQLRPTIDEAVAQAARSHALPLVDFDPDHALPNVNGVLIESDASEADNAARFERDVSLTQGAAGTGRLVFLTQAVQGTSFSVDLVMMVSARTPRVRMDELCQTVVRVITASELRPLLY